MKNLKEVIQEWNRLGNNNNQIVIPNYFVDIKSNIDMDTFANEITSALERNHLTNFNNDSKYCYYYLNEPGVEFSSFIRFHNLYKNDLSKFNFTFNGVILIDVSAWTSLEAVKSEELDTFLNYLANIQEGVVFIFVSSRAIINNNKLYQKIASKLFLDRIDAKNYINQKALNYMFNLFSNHGYSLDNECNKMVSQIVNQILDTVENDVFKSIKIIFNKIIFMSMNNASNSLKSIKLSTLESIYTSLVSKTKESNGIF